MVASVIEELLPFDCQNVNDFSNLNHNLVPTNGWNFMKLIMNTYDHDVVMHVKFFMVSSVIEELLSFDCLNVNGFSPSSP